uniref:Uncharacterized protein n=1 Tax=Panstrongylus lignarius TaxID=156445 RepID=A0A224XSE7_9HEMI
MTLMSMLTEIFSFFLPFFFLHLVFHFTLLLILKPIVFTFKNIHIRITRTYIMCTSSSSSICIKLSNISSEIEDNGVGVLISVR